MLERIVDARWQLTEPMALNRSVHSQETPRNPSIP